MKKSELRQMIREVLREELNGKKYLEEDITAGVIDEKAVYDCLSRIEANSGDRLDDWATVRLSVEDLKKALKVGTTISHGKTYGRTIPAQIIDSANLVFMYHDSEGVLSVTLELHGDARPDSDYNDANEYLGDCIPIISHLEIAFDTEEEALEYFKNEILPNADAIAHDIIQRAWEESGFKDYSGITDYEPKYL